MELSDDLAIEWAMRWRWDPPGTPEELQIEIERFMRYAKAKTAPFEKWGATTRYVMRQFSNILNV